MSIKAAMEWQQQHQGETVERLVEWLKIPSISTDPAYGAHCQTAAEWAAGQLRECGLSVEICPTGDPAHAGDLSKGGGHPVVLAHCG